MDRREPWGSGFGEGQAWLGHRAALVYIPVDHYLWDFWILPHEGTYHLYYLKAPRSLPDPELRHFHTSIGHAVSSDLLTWHDRGTVLRAGTASAWDDRAIWTGSAIYKDGHAFMLYTGTCRAENRLVQRIGLATSEDLHTWVKHPANPIMESARAFYEQETDLHFSECTWRDPFLFDHDGTLYAFVTARTRGGAEDGRGCIGLARADDGWRFEVLPPAFAPGLFSQMEVPQLIRAQRAYVLLFSVEPGWHAGDSPLPKKAGTYYARSCDPCGGFCTPRLLIGDHEQSHYGAKLIEGPDGQWYMLSWLHKDARGRFVGGLSDPQPVNLAPDGTIALPGSGLA